MSKLPKSLVDHIHTEARKIEYGNITIHFRGKEKVPDVEVTHKKKFEKDTPPDTDKVEQKTEFKNG